MQNTAAGLRWRCPRTRLRRQCPERVCDGGAAGREVGCDVAVGEGLKLAAQITGIVIEAEG